MLFCRHVWPILTWSAVTSPNWFIMVHPTPGPSNDNPSVQSTGLSQSAAKGKASKCIFRWTWWTSAHHLEVHQSIRVLTPMLVSMLFRPWAGKLQWRCDLLIICLGIFLCGRVCVCIWERVEFKILFVAICLCEHEHVHFSCECTCMWMHVWRDRYKYVYPEMPVSVICACVYAKV